MRRPPVWPPPPPLLLLAALLAHAGLLGASAATLYEGCPGVPDDWLPECWIAAHARIQVGGDRMLYQTPFTSRRWGNVLSPYFQARALALLAGHGFHNYVGFERYWLQHLPKHVPPSTCPNITAFQQACAQCDEESWAYAHRCAGAWTWIRPTIIHDTHAAFAAWAARATRFTPPAFQPGDVVIQSRCSNDTVLVHPEYGPVGFSFYANIPPAATRITVVADQHHRAPLCALLHDAQLAWLRARFPDAAVTLTGSRDPHLDFARLLLAPILFKDAQSSFGLWAALANRGEVWSVPLLPTYTNTTEPDLGPHWHWVDVPVLYPHVAAAAGITLDQPDAILQWLRDN